MRMRAGSSRLQAKEGSAQGLRLPYLRSVDVSDVSLFLFQTDVDSVVLCHRAQLGQS